MGDFTPSKTYRGQPHNVDPGLKLAAITPNDSADVNARGLYVGTGGDLKVTPQVGADVTFKNVPSGTTLAIFVKRVLSTGTTAGDIVALD